MKTPCLIRQAIKSLILMLLCIAPVQAQEVIQSFQSDIEIADDGTLTVTETITVVAESRQIKHGIYRDFPTRYTAPDGHEVQVGFKILSIEKNDRKAPYHTRSLSNGIRIYIGDKDIRLTPGKYRYRLRYRTNRQLGYFADHDELYWNVTGNGWQFPIKHASARVTLPQPVDDDAITMTGYTGPYGSKEQAVRAQRATPQTFTFATTRALAAKEGFTLVLDWPKGIVTGPSRLQKQWWAFTDWLPQIVPGAGILLVFLYYLVVWWRAGRDPQSGVIIPRYVAPKGFSPAALRYIRKMGYDAQCFSSALINLAIKGVIEISQTKDKDFVLKRTQKQDLELAPGEWAILTALFGHSQNKHELRLTQKEHKRLAEAMKNHRDALKRDFEKKYFLTNLRYFLPGIGLSIAVIIGGILSLPSDGARAAIVIALIALLILSVTLGSMIFSWLYQTVAQRSLIALLKLLTLSCGIVALFWFGGLNSLLPTFRPLLSGETLPLLIATFLLLGINGLFYYLLKAPTAAGRQLLDEIEGLKLYLNVAEEDDIRMTGQPRFTTDIYERLLPFAVALGVASSWSQRLEKAIAQGLIEKSYHPPGLHQPYDQRHSVSGLSDNFVSKLGRSVSAAAVAPGSSSGSGGGFSGGGGGGGGGGGW